MILGRRPDMGARALRLVRTGIALFTGCATATSCVPPPPVPAVTLRAGYVACLHASDLQLFLDMPVGEVGRWDGKPWNVRMDPAGATYAPTGHLVAGLMFFGTSAVALVVLSRRLAADPSWAGLAPVAAAAGVLALLAFVASGAFVMPDDAPLHAYAGLVQRAMILAFLFPCRVWLSVRMLRLARSAQPWASTSSSLS